MGSHEVSETLFSHRRRQNLLSVAFFSHVRLLMMQTHRITKPRYGGGGGGGGRRSTTEQGRLKRQQLPPTNSAASARSENLGRIILSCRHPRVDTATSTRQRRHPLPHRLQWRDVVDAEKSLRGRHPSLPGRVHKRLSVECSVPEIVPGTVLKKRREWWMALLFLMERENSSTRKRGSLGYGQRQKRV